MHATSFHQLPKHHFKLRLIVDTGGTHPNMIRENFIVNSRWGSESIEPGSLQSAGMQELMRSQSTNRLSSHYPVQSPSVCHKHVPISQLRNCLLPLVLAFDCIAPSSKNDQTGCFAFRHTSWGYFTDQFMWFVFSIGGISSIPPCVDNVVSFEEQGICENQGSRQKGLLQEEVQDMSLHRVSRRRSKAIWWTGPRPAENKFNRVFE